jgi:hypothetical protein
MNTIDWLRETAKFMVADRPDVYDYETAVEELSVGMDTLREANIEPFSCIMFTSYALMRIYMEGVEEFILSRKLSSVVVFEAEHEVGAYSYHFAIDLPDPVDMPPYM